MPKGKTYPKELKQEVLAEVTKGEKSVSEIANIFGIIPKNIYNWMAKSSQESGVSLSQYNRLKRENAELLQIIGELTHNIKKGSRLD